MRADIFPLAATFMAVTINAESSIPGYGVDILSWDFVIPDGSTITLNGTVQEVYTQLVEQHPEIKIPEVGLENREDNLKLAKRDSVICGNWAQANTAEILYGIRYLRGLDDAPSSGPGPNKCARVSCSYDAAIWWCNDNTVSKRLDSWIELADGARLILNTCASAATSVSGQNFHDDLWNVIVRYDEC